MKTWHQTSFLFITSKYRPGCTFGLALLQLPQGRGQARRETLVRNHRQRLPVWDEQLVGEGPKLQSRAEPAGRIKTQCYHGRTEQDINLQLVSQLKLGAAVKLWGGTAEAQSQWRADTVFYQSHTVLRQHVAAGRTGNSGSETGPGTSGSWIQHILTVSRLLHSDLPGRIFYPPSPSPPAGSGSWCSRCKGSLEIRQGWVTGGHITKHFQELQEGGSLEQEVQILIGTSNTTTDIIYRCFQYKMFTLYTQKYWYFGYFTHVRSYY